tara:strand:- start:20646 stop:21476 length:831 start_codon:yes stop_codon:yes gene_type:complete
MAQKQLTDEQVKAKIIAQHQQDPQKDLQFPTEIVPLPSRGLVYPKDHPLAAGQVEIKYMTAREEDILTNTNLLKAGRALDELYKKLVIGNGKGEPVDIDEMITGDKSALMLASRILGYGNEYTITLQGGEGEEFSHEVDLNELTVKDVDYNLYKNSRELDYKLPTSGITVTFKFKTSAEESILQKDISQLTKSGKSQGITIALKHSIVAIDGDRDTKNIHNFIENHLLARDSLQLRGYIASVTPDYDLTINIDRSEHGFQKDISLPIDTNFFWPRA